MIRNNITLSGFGCSIFVFKTSAGWSSGFQIEYVIRVHVLNSEPQKNSPLLIVIKQPQHILSFEVPIVINEIYSNVSRTLCPIRTTPEEPLALIISISSFNSTPLPYVVRAEWVQDFDLRSVYNVKFKPQPLLLRYHFKADGESVAVRISSNDDVCMTFSLQPLQVCLQYEDGFFVLLTLEATDYLCKGMEKLIPPPSKLGLHFHTQYWKSTVHLNIRANPPKPIFSLCCWKIIFVNSNRFLF
ncbi:unnamed protein product [Echinostoma caproni]|uniref:SHR-BD domain-containing protein n=1 Tax=Echinostoma caproni TaxID=27848 RepID=A0A183AIH3_9TREM|nr:unnamed protein product [Echinostoma caproni]